jgi:hypothetical protein
MLEIIGAWRSREYRGFEPIDLWGENWPTGFWPRAHRGTSRAR